MTLFEAQDMGCDGDIVRFVRARKSVADADTDCIDKKRLRW